MTTAAIQNRKLIASRCDEVALDAAELFAAEMTEYALELLYAPGVVVEVRL